MKIFNMKIDFVLIYSIILVLLVGCSEQDYFKTEPIVATGKIDSDTYTYLVSKPEQFSDFVEIIDLTNSKDLINSIDHTILAPQNYSINRFVFENGKNEITDFPVADLNLLLQMYIINSKVISDALIDPITISNINGDEIIFQIKRESWKGVDNAGPEYISIINLKNIEDDTDDVQAKVVTPDIETISGIVQVLSIDHLFGF